MKRVTHIILFLYTILNEIMKKKKREVRKENSNVGTGKKKHIGTRKTGCS